MGYQTSGHINPQLFQSVGCDSKQLFHLHMTLAGGGTLNMIAKIIIFNPWLFIIDKVKFEFDNHHFVNEKHSFNFFAIEKPFFALKQFVPDCGLPQSWCESDIRI